MPRLLGDRAVQDRAGDRVRGRRRDHELVNHHRRQGLCEPDERRPLPLSRCRFVDRPAGHHPTPSVGDSRPVRVRPDASPVGCPAEVLRDLRPRWEDAPLGAGRERVEPHRRPGGRRYLVSQRGQRDLDQPAQRVAAQRTDDEHHDGRGVGGDPDRQRDREDAERRDRRRQPDGIPQPVIAECAGQGQWRQSASRSASSQAQPRRTSRDRYRERSA